MSIFKKLFNKSTDSESQSGKAKGRSKYMPEEKLPLDEQFIHNFTQQGGRFLYAVDENQLQDHFEDILVEHDFFETDVFCYDDQLKDRFNQFNLTFNNNNVNSSFFLSTCEYVIADNGAILFSSNQIKESKPAQLPETFVVIASTSQIVESIGEGLRGIKIKSKETIPTNITTLKNFQDKSLKKAKEKELMNYGVPNKRLYLLLLEDL
ncbi:LUD domain-containing protein [Nonlabens ponticola]|uniref:Lactate utilization protein B/C n=1 Tax=Nonlabens ponticola TaxID=2496866 RepID=A0A3S9N115_9FLAO|nr:LUD domain-containing protein [Nonlabens ponticola]AZQ45032.1 lactate utilization protein B/C [Nonlabens ponticola]